MEPKPRNYAEQENALSSERLRNWCIWKVVLPLGMFALFYPLYRYVLELGHPFQSAFAHGDLILFSVLILLEAAVEGEHIRYRGAWFHVGMHLAKVMAFFLILVFGFIKTDVMLQEIKIGTLKNPGPVFVKLEFYSYLNWIIASFAVVYSLLAFWSVVAREASERLAEFAEINPSSGGKQ
jgi:hypothetical protein